MNMKVERNVAAKPNGDAVDELIDGVGRYSGKSLAELSKEYGELKEMTMDAAYQLKTSMLMTCPKEITKERYWHMLEVLPPCRWVNNGTTESFFVSEAYSLDLHSVYVRIGQRYYEMLRPVSSESHAHWVALCSELEAA